MDWIINFLETYTVPTYFFFIIFGGYVLKKSLIKAKPSRITKMPFNLHFPKPLPGIKADLEELTQLIEVLQKNHPTVITPAISEEPISNVGPTRIGDSEQELLGKKIQEQRT